MESTYTIPFIKGKILENRLPDGIGLVLEGGGTRGFYSAGVLDGFLEEGILFPYIIGVSAGAANVCSYIAGQHLRNRQVLANYVGKKEYLSAQNLIFKRSMFDFKYVFHTVPRQHIGFDWDTFKKQEVRYFGGALDCQTGKNVWFEKNEVDEDCDVLTATCSVPVISRIVNFNGFQLLDGGIADPIPIEKSIADGNQYHVIVLTRNEGYRKSPFKYKKMIRFMYRQYPRVAEAIIQRHEVYNRQLELCEKLERDGKALIIRPLKELQSSKTTGADIPKLLELYDEGIEEGKVGVQELMKRLETLKKVVGQK